MLPESVNTFLGTMELRRDIEEAIRTSVVKAFRIFNDQYLESLPWCIELNESPIAMITTIEIYEALERRDKLIEFRRYTSFMKPYPIIMR